MISVANMQRYDTLDIVRGFRLPPPPKAPRNEPAVDQCDTCEFQNQIEMKKSDWCEKRFARTRGDNGECIPLPTPKHSVIEMTIAQDNCRRAWGRCHGPTRLSPTNSRYGKRQQLGDFNTKFQHISPCLQETIHYDYTIVCIGPISLRLRTWSFISKATWLSSRI